MTMLRNILIGGILLLGGVRTALSRDFIVLMDGTGNVPPEQSGTGETNVWRLAKLLGVSAPDERPPTGQLLVNGTDSWVMYVYGVGTDPSSVKGQVKEEALGGETRVIVQRAMESLEESGITEDDEVVLFGFSRGAATVRLLANRIYNQRIRNRPTTIRFIGIWDTVAAIGIPKPEVEFREASIRKDFREISEELTIPPIVKHVVHLVALDEQRSAFWPTLARATDLNSTKVDEVWFAGSHSDIGGGWDERSEDNTHFRLWQVTLEYMLRASHGVEMLKFDRVKSKVDGFRSNFFAEGIVHKPEWLDATRLAGKRIRSFEEVLESSGLPANSMVRIHQSVNRRIEKMGRQYHPKPDLPTGHFEWDP